MRRLGRWLLNTAAAISLVLCLATVVLAARSYHGRVDTTLAMSSGRWEFRCERAKVDLTCIIQRPPQTVAEIFQTALQIEGTGPLFGGSGPRPTPPPVLVTVVKRRLHVHLAFVALALLGLSSLTIAWRILPRTRLKPGCCRKCGYNLTANTSGICPECGTPIEKGATAE